MPCNYIHFVCVAIAKVHVALLNVRNGLFALSILGVKGHSNIIPPLIDTCYVVRDWSLITGTGGGYKMGKSRVRNFLHPPP